VVTIERAAGEMIAAPRPWIVRAAINTAALSNVFERPHASDASVNRSRPATKIRRRPSRSAMRPPRRRNPPNAIEYAVNTHCTV
jgi:hypothetical protein